MKKIEKKELIPDKYLQFIPKFKEEKTQKITTLILTIFAFSFFGFFAISPTLSTIAQLKKELSDNQFVNERLDEKIRNLSILQQKYLSLDKDLSNILSALPNYPQITLLVAQIQAIAKSNNIIITRLQTYDIEISGNKNSSSNDQNNDNNYSNFNFSLGVEGSYDKLINFLEDLSNFDRIIIIEGLAMSKNTTENNIMQLDIKGKAFFKP